VRATQSNCYGALDFLSPDSWTMPPAAPSWMDWLQDSGSHTAVWVWVVSQKDWRSQGGTSWILAMYWYSILVKNVRFSCFLVLPRAAEAQVIWGSTIKRFLIVYFIGNISAEKYQNALTYIKVIANHRWDVFLDTVCNQWLCGFFSVATVNAFYSVNKMTINTVDITGWLFFNNCFKWLSLARQLV